MASLPEIVEVEHGSGAYPIVIQDGLLTRIGGWLEPYLALRRVFVVSDEQVWASLGERLASALLQAKIGLVPLIVEAGEQSKSWEALIDLAQSLIQLGLERSDTILAFGGGVVGDLAGFAASIVKRGCSLVQVPTSLLAQVDSSVGGKTGINVEQGKNLIGTFHQPAAVFIDPELLETLPERQLRAGYAEIVKYGLIGDLGFFAWCEGCGPALIAGHPGLRSEAIAASARAKAKIVARDERETSGERALLNFGHSFGHALEAETGFGDTLLHGEAVAVGMCLALRYSAALGHCDLADAQRVEKHLASVGLPTTIAELGIATSGERLAEHMRHDKKAAAGKLSLILSRGIGSAFVDLNSDLQAVAAFLDREIGRDSKRHAALR
jgi:3-dehydroquinate synthase